MIKLRSIFFVFLRLGALTFGGGLAMLPIIKRDIVDRGWIPEEEFSDYIAVAQVAPGMIAINIATLVGMHLRRRLGALVAVIGVALPSLIVITLIAALLGEFAEIEWVQKALKGIIIVVVILLGTAIIEIGSKAIRNVYLLIYAIFCFIAVYSFGISSVAIIGLSFALGTAHTLIRKRVGQ
jgi:chromate transporter